MLFFLSFSLTITCESRLPEYNAPSISLFIITSIPMGPIDTSA
jgi:hypothetical protein